MFPAVPVAVHDVVIRWVVVPMLMVLAPAAVLVIDLNVLLPLMISVPLPPWFKVMLVYAMPPPSKVLADALVRLMVPVPVTVRLVEVAAFHPPVPDIANVPEPTAIVLVPVPDVATELDAPDNVTLYPLASKVPVDTVIAPAAFLSQTKAFCNVTDPPGLSIIKL